MKLGIITTPDAAGISHVKSLGLECAEFDINVGSDIDAVISRTGEIKEQMKRDNISVAAIGRWGPDRITENGPIAEELKTEARLIDFASEIGCPVYISGCNYIEKLSFYANCTFAIEYLGKLITYGKTKNVKICVYNCNWNTFVNCDPAWEVILGHLPELGIKFDPSHSMAGGRDYLAEAEKWGERFYHVHLKGSLYSGGRHIDDPPAGLDGTDWQSLMAMLYYKHYDGALSIEPHSPTWQGELGEKGVRYTIDYFRKMIF